MTSSNIRHERSGQSLEEQGNEAGRAGKVRAKSGAHGKKTSEECDDGEEKGDQVEGEHETREVIVVVGADEASRDTSIGSKVAGRVEGKSRHRCTAVSIMSVNNTTDSEKGPSRRVASTSDSGGVGLKEVGQVEGSDICDTRKDHKERKQDACGQDDEGCEPDNGA